MHAQKAFSPSFQWRVAQASPRAERRSAAKSRELRSIVRIKLMLESLKATEKKLRPLSLFHGVHAPL